MRIIPSEVIQKIFSERQTPASRLESANNYLGLLMLENDLSHRILSQAQHPADSNPDAGIDITLDEADNTFRYCYDQIGKLSTKSLSIFRRSPIRQANSLADLKAGVGNLIDTNKPIDHAISDYLNASDEVVNTELQITFLSRILDNLIFGQSGADILIQDFEAAGYTIEAKTNNGQGFVHISLENPAKN